MTPTAYQIENLETGAVAVCRSYPDALTICRAVAASLADALGLRPIEAFSETDVVIYGCGTGGYLIALFRVSKLLVEASGEAVEAALLLAA